MKDETISVMLSTQSVFSEKVIKQEQKRLIAIEKLARMIDRMLKSITYGSE
jgi:hypothetical protein